MPTRRALLFVLPWLCTVAAAAEPTARLLLGRWRGTERAADGTTGEVEFEFRVTGRFDGSLRPDRQSEWRFAGDWSVRDRQLTWVYTGSSVPLAPELREDVDEIVSVDAQRLVLRSRRSGELRSFTRAP
jgi:hypothetical protein